MVHQHFVHLARGNFLTAAIDDFLEPPGDGDVALRIHHALVAGAEPAVGIGLAVGLGIVFVAGGDVGAANHDLPRRAARQNLPVDVHDGHLRPRRETYAAGNALAIERVAGHLVRGFGHAIGLDHRCVENFFEFANDLRRQRGRRRADEAQRIGGDDILVVRRPCDDGLMHGRHGRVPGGPGFGHPCKKFQRVETGSAENASPARQRRQQSGDETVDVEQRHDVQAAIAGGQLHRIAYVAGRGADIALRQRDDLGAGRGARGVQNKADIVALRVAAIRGRRGGARIPLGDFECARTDLRGQQFENADAEFFGHGHGGGLASLLDQQRLGAQIGQVEFEFIGAIAGVQRRCRGAVGHGNKGNRHFRAIRQHNGHTVVTANAQTIQGSNSLFRLRAQRGKVQRFLLQRANGGIGARLCRQQLLQGGESLHGEITEGG